MDEQLRRAPKKLKTFCFYWTLGGDDGQTVEGFIQAYASTKPEDLGAPDWESIDQDWEPPDEADSDAIQPGTFVGPRGAFGDAAFAATMKQTLEAGFEKSKEVNRRLQAGERFLYTVHGEGVGEYKR